MKKNFTRFYDFTLKVEGYYSSRAKDVDPGGQTLYGISREYWPDWEGWKVWDNLVDKCQGIPPQDIAEIELQEDLIEFYRWKMWNAVHGDFLSSGVDLLMADMAVNLGPARATEIIQEITGAKVDGIFGPKTLKAILDYDHEDLVEDLTTERLKYYNSRPEPRRTANLNGWFSRSVKSLAHAVRREDDI